MFHENEVRAGIALLDHRFPGWRERIDLDKLNMAGSSTCILGQLYGDFGEGTRTLLGFMESPHEHGFSLSTFDEEYPFVSFTFSMDRRREGYDRLTKTWKTILQEDQPKQPGIVVRTINVTKELIKKFIAA